jgi:hypothetical protein
MSTHTVDDLESMPNSEDVAKAKGFIQRSSIVICAALSADEVKKLNEIVRFSKVERRLIESWSSPSSLRGGTIPPGIGKILIKVGGYAGIPVQVILTKPEYQVSDTNQRWHEQENGT